MEGQPIYRVGDLATIEIESDILSSDIRKVREGQRVIIFAKALGNEEIEGTVDLIYPAGFKKISALGIEEQRNTVLVAFDNSEVALRPGLAVDIKIIVAEKDDTLIVPEQATFKKEGNWYAYVANSGKAELRKIEVGLRNDDHAEILSGIKENEVVITELISELQHSSSVKVIVKD
jgi:HlyD family secretion protein